LYFYLSTEVQYFIQHWHVYLTKFFGFANTCHAGNGRGKNKGRNGKGSGGQEREGKGKEEKGVKERVGEGTRGKTAPLKKKNPGYASVL
jgi:hypothetical protein